MTKIKKQIWTVLLAILLMIAVLLQIPQIRSGLIEGQKEWQELTTALDQEETIIDAVTLDHIAYSIISSEGREDYGDRFVVLNQDSGSVWRETYSNDFTGLKPWKLELGNVDGDEIQEILIAVRKTTHFDKEEENRMFIFQYDGEKLVKKWTGSQTGGIWSDFIIGDLLPIQGEELIFLEQSGQGEEKISVYYWFDFGFVHLADSGNYRDITDFQIAGENKVEIIFGEEQGQKAVLTIQDGRLLPEATKDDQD
jgi:hypothetical protein